MTRRVAQLAEVMHQETGKPHGDATLEAALAIDHLAWAASHAEKVLKRRKVSSGLVMANQAAYVEYQPLGVIGVIGPWNYPVFTPMGSIVYALAAGNADFKRVHDALKAFRNEAYLWFQVAEYTYDNFMIRARARS